jgi:hypothetical protein
MKAEGLNEQHVIRFLKIANNDIPSVEYRCQEFEREEASLKVRNQHAARTYQQFGAILAATDPVAVGVIFKKFPIPHKLNIINEAMYRANISIISNHRLPIGYRD